MLSNLKPIYSVLLKSHPIKSTSSINFNKIKPAILAAPARRQSSVQQTENRRPIKFTTSQANVDYKATENFYSEDPSLPKSHNAVISFSLISGIFYLIFLRDDIEDDGGVKLVKPIHETIPDLAIPLLQSAIAENRKFGVNTQKLEAKLAELLKEPDRFGGEKTKYVEN